MRTKLTRVDNPAQLKTADFVNFPESTTPGNVGFCLSGGGSRAMAAGMGQLRGLKTLCNDKDKNIDLISQTRLISTVSGGTWVGSTFVYLPDQYSDDTFLGHYTSPAAYTIDNISHVDDGMVASHLTHGMSLKSAALQIIFLLLLNIPKNDIWKTLVSFHLLKPYDLYKIKPIEKKAVESFFTYNQQSLQNIVNENPDMSNIQAYLVKDNQNSSRRPYLVCNMSMFVNKPGESFQYLIPVQSTPFYTGVLPSPSHITDINNQPVGGGAVESFAFNSVAEQIECDFAIASQTQPFSLADAISTSSAFFASVVQNIGENWQDNFDKFLAELPEYIDESLKHLGDLIKKDKLIMNLINRIKKRKLVRQSHAGQRLLKAISEMKDLVPKYQYWSVNSSPDPDLRPVSFADGGDLENSGVAAALVYEDVERLISFANSDTPITAGKYGVLDKNNKTIPGTQIIVDWMLPPLFGYRPYDKKLGYQLYENSKSSQDRIFKHNQVFPSDAFPELLKGLWEASGNHDQPGSNRYGANYKQTLTTVENLWFGVKGGRQVTMLWVYTNFISSWYDLLSSDIQKEIFNNNPTNYYNFPNYSLNDTQLTPEQVNLLAGLTSWNIVEGSPELFLSMYQDTSNQSND